MPSLREQCTRSDTFTCGPFHTVEMFIACDLMHAREATSYLSCSILPGCRSDNRTSGRTSRSTAHQIRSRCEPDYCEGAHVASGNPNKASSKPSLAGLRLPPHHIRSTQLGTSHGQLGHC